MAEARPIFDTSSSCNCMWRQNCTGAAHQTSGICGNVQISRYTKRGPLGGGGGFSATGCTSDNRQCLIGRANDVRGARSELKFSAIVQEGLGRLTGHAGSLSGVSKAQASADEAASARKSQQRAELHALGSRVRCGLTCDGQMTARSIQQPYQLLLLVLHH